MKKDRLHKTIEDFKVYLDGIERMAKKCSPEQRADLNQVLTSLLVLLVGFKKGTHLGEVIINFKQL